MIVVRARWLLPIADRPLLNGWVALDRGRIAAVGRAGASLPLRDGAPLVDLGAYAVLPALVNAHVHLELSWLEGRVPPAGAFTEWVAAMLSLRQAEAPDPAAQAGSIEAAITAMRASGTGFVGDISNTLASVELLRRSGLDGVVFHELLRFQAEGADEVLEQGLIAQERCGIDGRFPVSLSAHAPYSVSPRLFQGIRAAMARTPFLPTSVHLAESREEIELLATGGGPWRQLLASLGAWDDGWAPPGASPAEYLARMRVLGQRLLAVHAVHCTDADLAILRQSGATVVTCPRSNEHVGVGRPPVARFYRAGVPVAVGTDSLASNRDLNLFSEMAEMRRIAPDIPAVDILESATLTGARALGLELAAGTIEHGRPSRLIAVALPAEVIDVEEYLVSGIVPADVRWVEDLVADCGFAGRA